MTCLSCVHATAHKTEGNLDDNGTWIADQWCGCENNSTHFGLSHYAGETCTFWEARV